MSTLGLSDRNIPSAIGTVYECACPTSPFYNLHYSLFANKLHCGILHFLPMETYYASNYCTLLIAH